MKIIRPVATLCGTILDSNVAQDAPVWSSTVTYAKGDLAAETDCGAIVYESLVNSNLNNPLDTSPLEWLPIGASNYFAMFDDKNGTQTENLDSITYTVSFTGLVNSVALINIAGALDARIEIWTSAQDYTLDTPTVDTTVSLRDIGTSSYYEYFTYEIIEKSVYVDFDIGTFQGGTGRLTLTGSTGELVKLGSLVYGNQYSLGDALWGAGFGIKDYSTKEIDQFGNYQIIERQFQDQISVEVLLSNYKSGQVKKVLAKYRARPLLWSASDEYGVVNTFGYYTSFSGVLETPAGTKMQLDIQGL